MLVADSFPPSTLAIDFGTKRVGLAISQASLAEPLVILENNQDLFSELAKICHQYNAKQVLVGLSEQKMAQKTIDFVEELKNNIDLPIYLTDETLSSQKARAKLKNLKVKKRTQDIDHFAAAEFLQEWLDSR